MDTDVVAGIESGMETILVLSGVTQSSQIAGYPFQPHHVLESVAHIEL
jgi:NagD protein